MTEEMEDEDGNVTVTRAHLVDVLFEQAGLTKSDAKNMVEAFFGLIADNLTLGNSVKWRNFGQFAVREKSARPGRNPRSGEVVIVTARRVVVFHASTTLRGTVQKRQQEKR